MDVRELHFHLQVHQEGGSFYYNHQLKVAFPKYDYVCTGVQTENTPTATEAENETPGRSVKQDIQHIGDVETSVERLSSASMLVNESTKSLRACAKGGRKIKEYKAAESNVPETRSYVSVFSCAASADDVIVKVEQSLFEECEKGENCTYENKNVNSDLWDKVDNSPTNKYKTNDLTDIESPVVDISVNQNQVIKEKNNKAEKDQRKKQIVQNPSLGYPFMCESCFTPFDQEEDKTRHRCNSDLIQQHTCARCNDGHIYPSKKLLLKHLKEKHNKEFPFKCDLCSKPIVSEFDKKNHMLKHVKPPSVCNICDKTLSTPHSLMLHVRSHTGEKPYKCHLCDRAFRQQGQLNYHLLTHSDKRTEICEFCGKGYHNREKLGRHTRSCQKKFECETCGKKVADMCRLKLHMRVHTGEKPHICDMCGFACAHDSVLKRHVQYMHTFEKKHKCSMCEKRFVTYDSLYRHERVHKKIRPHICSHCGKAFSEKANLNSHLRKHTGEKPYICEVCGAAFAHNVVRKSHQAKCQANPPVEFEQESNPLTMTHMVTMEMLNHSISLKPTYD